ncbi:hypothetical protein BOBR111200_20650 [Bordetella bronchialis]
MNVPPVEPATCTPPVAMGVPPTDWMNTASPLGSVSFVRILPVTSDFSVVVFVSLPAAGGSLPGALLFVARPAGVSRLMPGVPAPG